MRVVDGKKVSFVTSESYFESIWSPSMYSTAKETGADVVFLLAPGKTGDDLSDDEIRTVGTGQVGAKISILGEKLLPFGVTALHLKF